MITSHRDQFVWPLGLAILLLLLEIFWPERKRPDRAMSPLPPSSNEDLRKAVALLAVLAASLQAPASPGSALRQYRQGDFPSAQREFERLAEKRPEDARLHYNAGASAYQAGEYEKALKHFQSALSPDNLALQQSAYYNLGNTHFRLGETQAEEARKSEAWEESIHDYESSLKLNPTDADARHNLEHVKQKLEELKQQQKQEKKNDQKQDKKDKDDKDDTKKKEQQDPKKDTDQKKDDKQDQNKQGSKDEEKKDSKQQQQKPEDKQEKQRQSAQNDKGKEDKDKAEQQSKSGEQSSKDDANKDKDKAQTAQSAIPGQMTKEQAEQLLNAVRAEEKAMIFQPIENKNRPRNRVFKDW